MAYETPKMALADMQGCYVGSTPARRWYDGGTLVYQGFSPASEQEFIQQTAAGGPAQLLKVYGKTIVNNQLVKNGDFSDGLNGWTIDAGNTASVSGGVITIPYNSIYPDGANARMSQVISLTNGHKMLVRFKIKITTQAVGRCYPGYFADPTQWFDVPRDYSFYADWKQFAAIIPLTSDKTTAIFGIYRQSGSTISPGDSVSMRDIRLIDLTLLYGAGHEPTTVAQFLADYPEYDPTYDPGSLQSNKTAELRAERIPVINVWDEEWENKEFNDSTHTWMEASLRVASKNLIPVFPSTTYYFKNPAGTVSRWVFYDANGNYLSYVSASSNSTFTTPADARYMKFGMGSPYGTTYNHDICINISDPAINGHYYPHWRGSLQLNLSTLTGKLNGEGASVVVYPDGLRGVGDIRDDAYGSTGVVRLGKRAYQAGDESDTSVLTDGTNTIYPLATPLTYTLDTPLPTDLTCEQGDILQRVSDNNCPFVGEMKFGL